MKKAKFWLAQIAMIAMASLVFGSPVFAEPPAHAKGVQGEEMKTQHANDNASFKRGDEGTDGDTSGDNEPVCTAWFNGVCIAYE